MNDYLKEAVLKKYPNAKEEDYWYDIKAIIWDCFDAEIASNLKQYYNTKDISVLDVKTEMEIKNNFEV